MMPTGRMSVTGGYGKWLVSNDPWPPPERSRWEWGTVPVPASEKAVRKERIESPAAVCRIDF